ncbi:hypothetical protein HYV85_06140 [Candidatus Woesearchaeota archaeon]|nr:hypothetical protein [Candidatus Woesearchaeota archaeon]MBI3037415.1 hypothetical protein [Candidatus Woesearchaeota archaeon]
METPGISSSERSAKAVGGVKHLAFLAAVVAASFLVFLVAALTASEDALALTTAVDTWVISGQTINVEGQSFAIYLSSRANEIAADYGKGSLFVKNNSCDAAGIARICLDNVQYDITDRVYKIKIRGISLAPVISIARETSKSEFLVGDTTTFTVTLKNTGGFARNVTFEERIPKEFEMTEAYGIPLNQDTAVWNGNLDESGTVSFSYTVKAKEAFDGSLIPSMTYFDGLKLKTVYSTKLALKTSSPLTLATIVGKSEVFIGQGNNITINLSSRLPETAVVGIEVIFDPGLKVVSWPYGAKNSSQFNYVLSSEIPRVYNQTTNASNLTGWLNTSKAWFFEFKATNTGNSKIQVKANYRPQGEGNASAVKVLPVSAQSVLVTNKGVIVRMSLKEVTLESNQGRRAKVWLQNLNSYAGLRNVYVNISTDMLYLPDGFIERMEPKEQVLLADKFFYAPVVDKSTGYVIATNVSYLSEFGDNFSASSRDTATVLPEQGVTLVKTVSASEAKSGDEIDVTVYVKNSRLTKLRGVYVSDNISGEFTVVGKTSAIIEVKSKSDETAFTYKLKVPHVSKAMVLYSNTTLLYSDKYNADLYAEQKDHVMNRITEVKVEPESLPLSLSTVIEDSSIYVGEEFDVKYRIANTATNMVAKNIVLKLPLDYGLDLIGKEENTSVQLLGPGESVVVANFDRRRAKSSGDVEFSKPVLEYENTYGDRYTVNGTSAILVIKDSYLQGPAILVEKSVPKKANNTDLFTVELKAKNIGTMPADVLLEDDGNEFRISLANGTEYALNFSKRHTTPGKLELPQAKATYRYKDTVYKTVSKASSVEIVDNPVLSIEKIVPPKVTDVELYTVMLMLKSSARTPVENITISDGERSWAIKSIPAEGHANLTYEEMTKAVGAQKLAAAIALYSYGSGLYKVASNSPDLEVEEKKLVSISKEISPSSAKPAEKVKVEIKARNLHAEVLGVIIADAKKTFTVELKPGEEKNVSYDALADEATEEPASATYTFKGQQLTTTSRQPEFTLLEPGPAVNETGQLAEKEKEGKKKGIISALLDALLKVLTWKRGG